MTYKTYIILLFLMPFQTFSQKSNTGNWYNYFGSQKIGSKWNWHNEIQHRNFDYGTDLDQLLIRTGIGYNIPNSNVNFLTGYAYVLSELYFAPNSQSKFKIHENRLFQQFILKQKENSVYLTHRYRLEERYIGQNFRLRFRYFISLNVPLNMKEMNDKAIFLSAYNEIFLNSKSSYFDRNRIYAGIGYVINSSLKFELGFMNQILESRNRTQFMVSFFNTIPILKE